MILPDLNAQLRVNANNKEDDARHCITPVQALAIAWVFRTPIWLDRVSCARGRGFAFHRHLPGTAWLGMAKATGSWFAFF